MAVSSQTNFQVLTLDGVNTSFAFTAFVGVSAASIVPTLRDLTGTVQSISSFTISLNPPATGQIWGVGGTITLPSVFPAGWTLTLERVLPLTQASIFTNQGPVLPELIESSMDRLVLTSQQINGVAQASVRAPAGETLATLPSALQRANRYLGFGPSGEIIAASGTVTTPIATLSRFNFSSALGNLTGGQTVFAATYTPGFVLVFVNGVQVFITGFTATNGTSVTLVTPVSGSDTVTIQAFSVGTFTAPGPGTVGNSQLANMPANSVKVNSTAGVAAPTDLVLGALQVPGRGAGNIGALTVTGGLSVVGADLRLADMPANTVKVRAAGTSGAASDLAVPGTRLIGRSAGNIEALSLGLGLRMSGSTVSANLVGTAVAPGGPVMDQIFSGVTGISRITIVFDFLSTSGVSPVVVRLGTSALGFLLTDYVGSVTTFVAAASSTALSGLTAATVINPPVAAGVYSGSIVCTQIELSRWSIVSNIARTDALGFTSAAISSSNLGVAGVDRIRLTTLGGTDTFDSNGMTVYAE